MKPIFIALGLAATAASAQAADAPSGKTLYKSECAACHIAYPENYLPMRSWKAVMADLANHFGEDASLDDATRASIETYLLANSADTNGTPRWLKYLPADEAPMRITEFKWFRHEHGSRVMNWIASHPEVGSVANCAACHKGAERGIFEDD